MSCFILSQFTLISNCFWRSAGPWRCRRQVSSSSMFVLWMFCKSSAVSKALLSPSYTCIKSWLIAFWLYSLRFCVRKDSSGLIKLTKPARSVSWFCCPERSCSSCDCSASSWVASSFNCVDTAEAYSIRIRASIENTSVCTFAKNSWDSFLRSVDLNIQAFCLLQIWPWSDCARNLSISFIDSSRCSRNRLCNVPRLLPISRSGCSSVHPACRAPTFVELSTLSNADMVLMRVSTLLETSVESSVKAPRDDLSM